MNLRPLTVLLPLAWLAHPTTAQEPDQTVVIKALEAQMKYDVQLFEAKPGARIKIVFENLDGMPHNLVVCKPANDKGMEVAQAAWALGDQGIAKSWIPQNPRIIAHTGMVQPKQREELVFKLPDEPGTYPYVCTFPGHAQLMNGQITAKAEGGGVKNLRFDYYVGNWDRLPDFKTLTPAKSGPAKDNKIDIVRDAVVESKQYFGLVYTGEIEVPKDGDYQFFLTSDDGARVLVDDKVVATYDGIHPAGEIKSGKTRLKAGTHTLRVEYFEAAGEEMLYVGWKGPGFSETAFTHWVPDARKPGAPEHNTAGDLVLAPVNGEAVMHRNFIEGISPRGIGVGYPGGINLAWDANWMNLGIVWRGAFLDVRRHWVDRGGGNVAPLGYDDFKPAPGLALAKLEKDDTPWPGQDGKRAKDLSFRGHRLDSKRFPTFQWESPTLGLSVDETYTPSGEFSPGGKSQLARRLVVAGKGPADRLFFRVAVGGKVELIAGGFEVDGKFRVLGDGLTLRSSAGKQELLAPIALAGGKADITVTYTWLD